MRLVVTDGGRAATGRAANAGDCVARALALAAGIDYDEAYRALAAEAQRQGLPASARDGVPRKVYEPVYAAYGGVWKAEMGIGTGCTMHLRDGEVPDGRLAVRLSRHITCVIDGVIHDLYDPSRDGTRCVYGYWRFP